MFGGPVQCSVNSVHYVYTSLEIPHSEPWAPTLALQERAATAAGVRIGTWTVAVSTSAVSVRLISWFVSSYKLCYIAWASC